MNSSGDQQTRRNQLFPSFASFPDPNGPSMQTGDEAFSIAEGASFKISGALGARAWLPVSSSGSNGSVFGFGENGIVVQPIDAPLAGVQDFVDYTLPAGRTITVPPNRFLVIRATGFIFIEGTIEGAGVITSGNNGSVLTYGAEVTSGGGGGGGGGGSLGSNGNQGQSAFGNQGGGGFGFANIIPGNGGNGGNGGPPATVGDPGGNGTTGTLGIPSQIAIDLLAEFPSIATIAICGGSPGIAGNQGAQGGQGGFDSGQAPGGNGGAGGAGGFGGALVLLIAPRIAIGGTAVIDVSATNASPGANGSPGADGSAGFQGGGGGGGGGSGGQGGCGGLIGFYFGVMTTAGAPVYDLAPGLGAAGGSGGLGGAPAGAGAAGGPGGNGAAGASGTPGRVVALRIV